MLASYRIIPKYISARPQTPDHTIAMFAEGASNDFLWFRLRQLADVPEVGIAQFSGTLAERRATYRDFRGFVRQARTYWDAGSSTNGSAAALPYYYGALQLAKAELLQAYPTQIQGGAINHGLRKIRNATTSIRGDYLEVTSGVFPLLYEKRTGKSLPIGTRLKAMNLLSLIPEIGMEMSTLGPTRPSSVPGYYALALNDDEAWSVVFFLHDPTSDIRERTTKLFLRAYEQVEVNEVPNWREIFSLSSRTFGGSAKLFQSRQTMTRSASDGTQYPDTNGAISQLVGALGHHVRPSGRDRADFMLTPTVAKSDPLVMPLDLVRYACMFYLSSLVRYSPSALDPITAAGQAYLMDSFVNEVPLELLKGALDGISGKYSYFEPGNMRL